MTKKMMAEALRKDQQRNLAAKAERIVVAGYPYSHNPYLSHEKVEDCYVGCVHAALPVDTDTITEYGMTQRLPFQIRVF